MTVHPLPVEGGGQGRGHGTGRVPGQWGRRRRRRRGQQRRGGSTHTVNVIDVPRLQRFLCIVITSLPLCLLHFCFLVRPRGVIRMIRSDFAFIISAEPICRGG